MYKDIYNSISPHKIYSISDNKTYIFKIYLSKEEIVEYLKPPYKDKDSVNLTSRCWIFS